MSNSIYGIIKKSLKPTLNGEKVEVRVATFITMSKSVWEDDWELQVERRDRRYAKTTPAKYFIDEVDDVADQTGNVVYIVPDGYTGHHDEYDVDDMVQLGTLLKKGARYYIETDLIVIEGMRREDEVRRMKENRMSVGEYGTDHVAYMNHLKDIDTQSETGHYTRRHGLEMYA